jgi:hypothetical protein
MTSSSRWKSRVRAPSRFFILADFLGQGLAAVQEGQEFLIHGVDLLA